MINKVITKTATGFIADDTQKVKNLKIKEDVLKVKIDSLKVSGKVTNEDIYDLLTIIYEKINT